MENDYLLTFELSRLKDELHICTDESGLESLIKEGSRVANVNLERKTLQ